MKSEFLESELELYVQRLLIHEFYRSGNGYRMLKVSPSEERLKGYDAKIIGLTPFYCQFKTSDFLSQGPLYKRREAFFKAKGWPCQPFYSFGLRVPNGAYDKKNPDAWQHNTLNARWNTNKTGVAYVAPVFHTRFQLDQWEPRNLWGNCRWFHSSEADSPISVQTVRVNGQEKCRLPSFDGLISVPPHTPVKQLNHHYCFTSHADITFHSETEFVEDGKPFGRALLDFAQSSIERSVEGQVRGDSRGITVGEVSRMLGEFGKNDEFLSRFISFGLFQTNMGMSRLEGSWESQFDRLDFVQRQIAVSASLNAYFGISTIALLKIEES
jgi:hypothetical protein